MNQERGSSRWNDDGDIKHSQDEVLQQVLADLPLPASALVIDLRSQLTYDYPLLWNLATEIEDLATQMRLKRVSHWEYLEECIDFLQVSTEEMSSIRKYITLTSAIDKLTFTSDAEFASYMNTSYINRVRSNRQSASVRTERGTNSSFHLTVGPIQSIVRVYFLIDMENEDTFAQAIHYATVLKQYNDDYDDPDRTGRDERLSVFAVCMNANPKQRDTLFHLYPTFDTAFNTVILIQAYRNDDTFIGDDIQAYEVEQILYTLLLASPGEITNEQNAFNDEDSGRYMAFVEQPSITPTCTIYMIGLSSTEYSARWGQRWLSYGLVAKLIELIEDTQEVEYGETLLQLPDGQQWFDSWWGRAQSVLPDVLPILLPQTQPIMTRPNFPHLSSLAMTKQDVETFIRQIDEWYGNANQQALNGALESIMYLSALLNNKARERNKRSREAPTSEDEALREAVALQEQAQQLLVSLFRGAKGALPRALLQLDILTGKLRKLREQAQEVPDLKRYQEQFKQGAEATREAMRDSFQTWQLPFLGTMLRSTAWAWMICLALIVGLGIVTLFVALWERFTKTLLLPFVAPIVLLVLFVLLLMLVLLVTISVIHRREKQLRLQRDAAMKALDKQLYIQQTEMQSLLVLRTALQLLTLAGVYDANSGTCAYTKHLRALTTSLKEAREEAVSGRERAYERLQLSLSATQAGLTQPMPWLNLNTRKDWLPWPQITKAFQRLYQQFNEGNVFFDELMRKLLQQAAPELPALVPTSESMQSLRSMRDDRKELQFIASELIAAIISTKVNGYNLVQTEPQIQRYLRLQARSLQEPSLFTESISSLEQSVKDWQLEQVIHETNARFIYEPTDSFFRRRSRTLSQILSTWVSHFCQLETEVQAMLEQQAITARLWEEHVSPDDAIADLQARYQMFGYPDFTREGGYDHFYLLLIPGIASEDFFASLDHIQLPHFQWVRFPDEEKLIYMHVHRTRFQKQDFSLTNWSH